VPCRPPSARRAGPRSLADEAIMNPVFAVCLAGALALWVGYFYWALRMIRGRKDGVRLFAREVLWNPFNICFRPSLLTDEGLRARKWFFVCSVGFLLCTIAALLVGPLLRS
jgi:hypothetical protein